MTFFPKRKRKNDDPPRLPAWIIVVVAIGLVVIVGLFFEIRSSNTNTSSVSVAPAGPTFTLDPILITATYVIQQATHIAQGTPQPFVAPSRNDDLDPLEITATYIVQQVTATAQAASPK